MPNGKEDTTGTWAGIIQVSQILESSCSAILIVVVIFILLVDNWFN